MTATLSVEADRIPLTISDEGWARVTGTRVSLEIVIRAYQSGMDPEKIVDSFPTLELADVYLVLGYVLRHPQEVKAYMAAVEAQEEKTYKFISERFDQKALKERLIARLEARASREKDQARG